jgi:hypothetical protein
LDGLGRSRKELLREIKSIQRAGSPLQTSFGFFTSNETDPEEPSQIFTWELDLLGMPISVHPLEIISQAVENITPLAEISDRQPGPIRVAGARLPGWGGGSRGFLFSDGTNMIQVHLDQRRVRRRNRIAAWSPMLLEGDWNQDPWGGGWLEVERYEILPIEHTSG